MSEAAGDNTRPVNERINFREPVIAGILAYLVPGAGHFYQRRFFKATIYFFCIVGIFVIGSSLGEAKAVHCRFDKPIPGKTRYRTLGFIAQAGIGLTTIPAIVQHRRHRSQQEASEVEVPPGAVVESFDADFRGIMQHDELGNTEVTGRVVGELVGGEYGNVLFEGTFKGKSTENGEAVEFALTGNATAGNGFRSGWRHDETGYRGSIHIGPKIDGLDNVTITDDEIESKEPSFAADRRRFMTRIGSGDETDRGSLEGTIERPLIDHCLVPLDDEALEHLNGRLGKYYELALVYTWIAGLLNLLAVWDAVQGPAYGYGDEPVESDDNGEKPTNEKAKADKSEPTAAPAQAT